MTRLNVDPSAIKFESIQAAEKGAMYLIQWNRSLELAVGFKIRNSDEHSGLLILTGDSLGSAEFFVQSNFEENEVQASKLSDDWTATKLVLEAADPAEPMNVGSAGILRNRNHIDVLVREGADRLRPLFVNLTELACHNSEERFETRVKLVEIEHPALARR